MNQDTVKKMTAAEMARCIDHTLLKPEAGPAAFDQLCDEAIQYGFKAVCVNSGWVAYAAEKLKGRPTAVCAVVGFPLGAMHRRAKACEARIAVEKGARELDMVLNVGALKSGDFDTVREDISAVRHAAAPPAVLKVIIETCLLAHDEKIKACQIARDAGADFVKTSTGFSAGGATVEDVALMRKAVGPAMGVKASGGIKGFETAVAMIAAGATRIGAGAGVEIIKAAKN
jgi:deoxyribose-phosphate aldolase